MSLGKYAVLLFVLVALAPVIVYVLGAFLAIMTAWGIGGHLWGIMRRKVSASDVV